MLDPRNQSYAAQVFADYRSENNHLLTKFRNVQTYLDRLKKLGDVERKEIVGGMFSLNSDLGPAFDSIDLNLSRLVEIVEKLIECLEKEKKELDGYLSKLKNATIESEKRLESLLINYNNEQYDYMQQLNTLIPGLIELADTAIGMEDETIEKTAESILSSFEVLINALKNSKTSKDDLYIALENILLKLAKNAKYLGEIIEHLGKGTQAGKFVAAFRSMPSLMRNFDKHRKNCGRDEDKDKLFTEIDKDNDGKKKKKLDEFMRDTLYALYKQINKLGTIVTKDAIDAIIKIELDMKELKKSYDKLFKKLQDAIDGAGLKYRLESEKKGLKSFIVIDDEGNSVTLGSLNFDDKKQKAAISFVLRTLENALVDSKPWKNNKRFKALIDENSDLFLNAKKSEDDDGDDEGKIKSEDWEELNSNFDSLEAIIDGGGSENIDSFCATLWEGLFKEIKVEDGVYRSKQLNKVLKFKKKNGDAFKNMVQSLLDFVYKNSSDLKKWDKDKWKEVLLKLNFLFN